MDEIREQRIKQGTTWIDALPLGDRLAMAAAYGSILGSSFDPQRSDLNLLLVLDPWEEGLLASMAEPIQLASSTAGLSPMLISRQELAQWPLLFPTKLHAILRRHRILRGEDLLSGLLLDPARIRRDCQVELANVALKLRRTYLHVHPTPAPLKAALLRFLPKMRDILRSLHQLAGGSPEDPLEKVVEAQAMALGFESQLFLQAWSLREQPKVGWNEVQAAYLGLEALIRQSSRKLCE